MSEKVLVIKKERKEIWIVEIEKWNEIGWLRM